jgi:hypothetical protein
MYLERTPGPLAASLLCLLVTAGAGASEPAADPPFSDEAAAWGIDFVHFNGMSGELYLPEITGAGCALLDYDGDGDLDAYLVQGSLLGPGKTLADATFPPAYPLPLSDRLYRNDSEVGPDGRWRVRFVDVTERSGLASLATSYGMGVATGDFNGDGWVDLYLASYGSNRLLRNRGDGTFEDVTAASGTDDPRWNVAASFIDYDRDGRLDLYLASYVDFSMSRHTVCRMPSGAPDYCGPLTYSPQPDRLFRNRGDGTFEDVSAGSGILAERGSGLGTVAADFDGDGWTDLYVANDGMANFLWINRHDGTFENDAVLAGCAVDREGNAQASMGVVAEDVDGDGDEDLFMTHLTGQTNTFYLASGDGLFHDRTVQTGLGPESFPFTGFGTAFLDYDNDGDLDLLVGNGAVIKIEERINQGDPLPLDQPNQLFRSLGGLRFEEATATAGPPFAVAEVTRGLALGDVDGDGGPDALMTNNAGPARLLVDRAGRGGHWVGARVVAGGTDAIGARLEIAAAGGTTLWRRVHTDGSYASASDPRVLVGLGAAERLAAVRVHWSAGTGGGVTEVRDLPADRYLVLYREAVP